MQCGILMTASITTLKVSYANVQEGYADLIIKKDDQVINNDNIAISFIQKKVQKRREKKNLAFP